MQRFVKIPSIMLCLFISLFGCGQDKATDKNTLVVALGSMPSSLDPRMATDANGMRIVGLIFNSLVRIGPDLQVQADAARSWTFDKKALRYIFTLYPQLKFAGGRPLTASDIIFSFDEFRSDKSLFKTNLESIQQVSVQGDNSQGFQVQLQLKHYSPKFLSTDLPTVKLLPQAEIRDFPEAFTQKPFGTGPFALEAKDNSQIRLVAQRHHPIQTPKIKYLVFKIIRDDFTRFQKTLKGAIDIAQVEIAPNKVAEFERRPKDFKVYKYPGLSMTYLLINFKDPDLAQLKLRQALAKAINRAEIIKYKLSGLAMEATSVLTPSNPYFYTGLKNIEYRPGEAAAMVAELGFKNKSFTLKSSNAPLAIDNARVLANQISKSGLQIRHQSFEWGTFYGDIKAGNFQLATMRWTGVIDPDIYHSAFHGTEFPPGRNRGRYSNPHLDQMLDAGLKIADENARLKHYYRVQEIIFQDLAIIPLWYDQQVAVVHQRVKAYKPWLSSDFYPLLYVYKE